MKPIIKYQGGKTKEIPVISSMMPSSYKRIVEPFCGGAAVSMHFEQECLLNDTNSNLVNLYNTVKGDDFTEVYNTITDYKKLDRSDLEPIYYSSRDTINNPFDKTEVELAIAYIVVRQLSFSGMERYNNKGVYNVPFGHYKKMGCALSALHHEFLSTKAEITSKDAVEIIEECDEDDFVFLDPPYLKRLGYHSGDGGDSLHSRLVESMKKTKAKWLFVHTEDDFYTEQLSDYDITIKAYKYTQNFGKNKNHDGSNVNHMYVKNY